MKTALITGITGQDGSYLAELLLGKDYEVHGLVRRSSTDNTANIHHLKPLLHLHYGDVTDGVGMAYLINAIQPDEVYNLAAQSHVRISFDCPNYTFDTVANGALHILEAIRRFCPDARYYQASSSEMFGDVVESPQNELTPFRPRSPYGCAKCAAYWLTKNCREAYGLHASNGILFNHESERRGENFVTRKITLGCFKIKAGISNKLKLGNVTALRDWGHSREYMEAANLMLQQDKSDDYVIATGETHSVLEFAQAAFARAGLDVDEHLEHDPVLERPAEVQTLCGDYSKAKRILGWEPKIKFKELVDIMVDHDLRSIAGE